MPTFIKLLVSLIEKSSTNLIHECPYLPTKEIGIKNFIVNSNLLPAVAFFGIKSGEYLATLTFVDKKKELVFKTKIFCLLEKEKYKRKINNNKN